MTADIPYGAWPRCLGADRAAAYLGVSKNKFLAEVEAGIWPLPDARGARKLWDRACLDHAQDNRSGLDAESGEAAALRAIERLPNSRRNSRAVTALETRLSAGVTGAEAPTGVSRPNPFNRRGTPRFTAFP